MKRLQRTLSQGFGDVVAKCFAFFVTRPEENTKTVMMLMVLMNGVQKL